MFPLGHLGLTLAVVDWGGRGSPHHPLDWRIVLVGSLLPDLIDKPLSLVSGIGGRNVAHTLLFALALTLLLLMLRSRPTSPKRHAAWVAALLALAIGSWTHLLLDQMWALPDVLLWPFLGLAFPLDSFDLFSVLEGYRDPYILVGDTLGAAALGYFAWRRRSYRRANSLRFL